ncbi:MAG: hypothetical protein NVV83_01595 [Afipia sp.]|nr:hypothetical protein [Afipia sp.]
MSNGKMSDQRFERAVLMRDLARHFIEANGEFIPEVTPPMKEVCDGGLSIHFCTEFPSHDYRFYLIVDDDLETNRKRSRVMSVYWNEEGKPLVSNFRPGDWQERLMKLVPIESVRVVH